MVGQLSQYINEPIFPSLDDMDVADLIFYFNLYFFSDDHVTTVEGLLKLKNIELNDNDFTEVINIITPFIIWFKTI
jgi:hypothetical protein